MRVRQAQTSELSRVFALTHELSGGISITRHVVSCKRNRKLWSGMHYVLEDGSGDFLATLTAYVYRHPPETVVIGIANLFTPEPLRRQGHASRLLEGTIARFERRGQNNFYLLSDIGSDFYTRWGFRELPLRYEAAPECLPMLRCPDEAWEPLSTNRQLLLGVMAFVD